MGRAEELASRNLFDELIALRDEQRARSAEALWVIHEADVPVEVNPLGRMRWYLHPNLEDVSIQSLMVAVQELQPGESTGRLHYQGGSVIYFIEGHGRTVLDGETFEWGPDDVINTPIRPDGVTIQHTNTGSEVARFIEASPNLVHALGVDRGSGFDVLEPATAFSKSGRDGDA